MGSWYAGCTHGVPVEPKYQAMPVKAKMYIGMVCATGTLISIIALSQWSPQNLTRALCFLVVSAIASALKVSLPTITGTMSVNFLFILIGIVELDFPSALIIGCTGSLIQCLWKSKSRPRPHQVVFNTGAMAVSVAVSYYIYTKLAGLPADTNPVRLVVTACIFFLMNTIPVAAAIGITEDKSLRRIWYDCYFWCFPYYLGGASIAWILSVLSRQKNWHASLVLIPVIYFIYRSYRTYLGRLEDEKVHVEEMAALHLRTIEALALAIEAKDHTTHAHLRRVRIYAMEVAKDLGLPAAEMQALRAAALLHDIGKLAVPEQIISKPGKLTPEEFEKIKIHPVIGAEILESVQFPYPVVPIVRAHHEKWDGSGYPAGLKGEEIPIGARILSAVDCLDALASHRQYRRALPLDCAMEILNSETGKSFDPKVVEVLTRRYKELEQMALAQNWDKKRLSTHVKIEKGLAPAAGFEQTPAPVNGRKDVFDPLCSIAAARQEVQMLFELTQDLGNSLSLNETLSVLSVRLKRLVPYDSIAVYVLCDQKLVPEYVNGENFRLFSSLEIPVGEGLSGWVAQNRKPILNGNPSVEAGYIGDPAKFSTLRSALALPLEGLNGAVGVLALYRAEKDAFTKDNLRILLAISSKISLAIENALKYRQVENSATIDYLTNLPNARSLFLRLDSELARCRRMNIPLAVLVCDLDGFKQVNDGFGHLTGNKVLSSVANGLKANCREYDYVARMGGDEFVLLLPHITPESVGNRITQMMRIAAEAGEIMPGKRFLSMSVGEASYPLDGNDAEELLATADRRMYKNKQQQKLRRSDAPAVLKESPLEVLSVQ
jgi:diguanylate cyclase (GGDEF)-like protein/putative nucleotidyltransferase with HDIG domain